MKKHCSILLTLAITLALDLLTKSWAVAHLATSIKVTGFFELSYIQNPGIAFGLPLGGVPLLLLTGLLVGGFVWMAPRTFNLEKLSVKIALGMVLGGALGNFWDRLTLGIVRDFIAFSFWPAFNLADTVLTLGILTLLITFPRERT